VVLLLGVTTAYPTLRMSTSRSPFPQASLAPLTHNRSSAAVLVHPSMMRPAARATLALNTTHLAISFLVLLALLALPEQAHAIKAGRTYRTEEEKRETYQLEVARPLPPMVRPVICVLPRRQKLTPLMVETQAWLPRLAR
jgi:hypothetical protein